MKLNHPFICERCGGTIDRELMICPYCDTEYVNRATYKTRKTFLDKIYLTYKEINDIKRKNQLYNFITLDDTLNSYLSRERNRYN